MCTGVCSEANTPVPGHSLSAGVAAPRVMLSPGDEEAAEGVGRKCEAGHLSFFF